MFRIADGREHFYQWDLDRQIIVEDNTITEVHFCNRTDDCSLVVEVVDGLANVPNVILQKSFDIRVFGYDGKATRYDEAFKVKARTKPTDYVYTETEVKSYEYLDKRIDEIEKNGISEAVVEKAVKDYLADVEVVDEKAREDIETIKNTYATEEFVEEAVADVEVDLTGYATENYVKNEIAKAQLSGGDGEDIDLSGYATKDELPTKVSQLENDSKYITREEVPETDLSEYAKKSEIPDVSDFITSIPSEYITESELDAKGYATGGYVDAKVAGIVMPDLTPYAKKEDIPTVPTKVSAFENDKGYLTSIPGEYITEAELSAKNYLTEHQSLAAYATKTYVDNTVAENQPNLSKYALKTDIPSLNGYATESYVDTEMGKTRTWVNTKGYATEQYVDEAIAGIEIPEGPSEDVDLSNYVTLDSAQEITGAKAFNTSVTVKNSTQATNLTSSSVRFTNDKTGSAVVLMRNNTKDHGLDLQLGGSGFITSEDECLHFYSSGQGYYPTLGKPGARWYKLHLDNLSDGTTSKSVTDVLAAPTTEEMNTAIQEAIANIDIPEGGNVDLSEYAKKSEVPSIEGLASEKYVDDAIAAIETSDGCKIAFVDHSDTQETIEAILEAGQWPVFKGNEIYNFRLPLTRKQTVSNVTYYTFGATYGNVAYYIRYSSTNGWDTLVSDCTLVRKDTDLQANAIGDADSVLSNIKISGKIYSIPEGGSADLTNYYTKDETYSKTEVDNKIASSGGGGSSGGGSDVKVFSLPAYKSEYSTALIAELWALMQTWTANCANGIAVMPENAIFYIKNPNDAYLDWYAPERITFAPNIMHFTCLPKDEYNAGLEFYIYFNNDGTLQRTFYEQTGLASSGGSDWNYTTDFYDSGLYNAKEIYIELMLTGDSYKRIFSHVVFNSNYNEYLGNNTYQYFNFTDTTNYSPYWTYDGGGIDIYDANEYELKVIAYKS